MSILIIDAKTVSKAVPMNEAIEAMAVAFGQLSAGNVTMPVRTSLTTEKGMTLLMPCYAPSSDLTIKVVSVYHDNSGLNLPTVTATVLVNDAKTGLPLALIEGNSLTAIRTGATGGLAAKLLARKDAKIAALFGAGVQARTQLQALMAVQNIEQVNLISKTETSAQKLGTEIKKWQNAPQVNLVKTPKEAVSNADIIITATTSSTPVFNGEDIKLGTHITAIGAYTPEMQEIDAITVNQARIIVDHLESCLAEAGDLIIPNASVDSEIGEIINGVKPERKNDDEITLFKSVGVAIQDTFMANLILENAQKKKLGIMVDL